MVLLLRRLAYSSASLVETAPEGRMTAAGMTAVPSASTPTPPSSWWWCAALVQEASTPLVTVAATSEVMLTACKAGMAAIKAMVGCVLEKVPWAIRASNDNPTYPVLVVKAVRAENHAVGHDLHQPFFHEGSFGVDRYVRAVAPEGSVFGRDELATDRVDVSPVLDAPAQEQEQAEQGEPEPCFQGKSPLCRVSPHRMV